MSELDCWVLPENWQVCELFMQIQTQWNCVSGLQGMARIGLNYQGVLAVLDVCYPDADKKDLFSRLQVIEQEALVLFTAQ